VRRHASKRVGDGMKRKEDESDEQGEEACQHVDEVREPRANHLMR
jgi:hypothetical protein